MLIKKKPVETKKKPAPKKASKIKYPILKMGDKGEVVTQLQDFLSRAGSSIKITGVFNIGTRSAVCAFQKRNGLVVDGVVGTKTWDKLLKVK